MSSMAGLSSSCELHTNTGSTNLVTQGMSSNEFNQNSTTPYHLVITTTQLASPSSEGGLMLNNCIQYSAQDDVLSVPKFVPENSPEITNLLESVLDEGHIEETLNPDNSMFDEGEGNDGGQNDPNQHEHGGSPNNMIRKAGPKTSQYQGVTKCNEDRFEAFAWDNSIPGRRGRAVYIGGYSTEIEAARAHDLISLKIGGLSAVTNFPVRCYWKEIHEMQNMSKREYILAVRRRGKGFSGSDSDYRGVYRCTEGRQWQAWLGRDKGLPSIFLGTYYTPEDAARAHDIALIRFKGMEAITNFELTSYDVRGILEKLKNPVVLTIPDSLAAQITDKEVLFQRGNKSNDEIACPPNVNQPENNSTSNSLHQHNHQQLLTPQLGSSSSSSPSFPGFQNPSLIQSSSYNFGRLTETRPQLSNSSSSSSTQSCQNTNLIQSSTDNLGGLIGTISQLSSSPVSNSKSSSFQGYQNLNLMQSNSYNFGGLTGIGSQLSNSSSTFVQGCQSTNLIQSSTTNLGGLIGIGSQLSSSQTSSSSFQGYQNLNLIQSSSYNPSGLIGTGSQLSNSSSSSVQGCQNPNLIQSGTNNLSGLIDTGSQLSSSQVSNSSSSLSSFQGYQNLNLIQSSPYIPSGLTGFGSQQSNSSSLSSYFQGYENPNLVQSSPYNPFGWTGSGSQQSNSSSSSSSFFQGYQSSNYIQSPYNPRGWTRSGSQPSNLSLSPSSFQGYQNFSHTQCSPYDLGRLTRTCSSLSSFQGYENSNCIQSSPYNLGRLIGTRSQLSNSSSSYSSFHGYQNPNLIQSSPHNFGGLIGSGSQSANYGTSTGDYGALVPNLQGANLQQSMLLPLTSQDFQAPQAFQNQVNVNNNFNQKLQKNQYLHKRPSLLVSEGSQNLGSQNSIKISHLLPDFGSRLLGGDVENLSKAFNVKSPTYHMVTETPGPRAINNGVSSFGLLNSNGINQVGVRPSNQVSGAAKPQQPAMNQSHEPNHPNNLNQNTHQNLNSCASISFQNPCSQTYIGSQRQINETGYDFDISQFLNSAFMEEDLAGDFDAW